MYYYDNGTIIAISIITSTKANSEKSGDVPLKNGGTGY